MVLAILAVGCGAPKSADTGFGCMSISGAHLTRLSWSPDGSSLAVGATAGDGATVILRIDWKSHSTVQIAKDPGISGESVAAGPGGRILWTVDGSGSSEIIATDGDNAIKSVRTVAGQPFLWLNWQRDSVVGAVSAPKASPASVETMDVISVPVLAAGSPAIIQSVPAETLGSVWASEDGWVVIHGQDTVILHEGSKRSIALPGRFASLDPDRTHVIFVDPSTAALSRTPIGGGSVERLVTQQVFEGVVSAIGVIAYRAAGSFSDLCFAPYDASPN